MHNLTNGSHQYTLYIITIKQSTIKIDKEKLFLKKTSKQRKHSLFVFPVIFIQLFQESETVDLHNHHYDQSALKQNLLAPSSPKLQSTKMKISEIWLQKLQKTPPKKHDVLKLFQTCWFLGSI